MGSEGEMDGPRPRIRVVIVDRLRPVREGLTALLTCEGEFDVVGEAEGEEDALQRVLALRPDLVLLDLELPCGGGEGLVRRLREAGVTPIVVALGLNGDLLRPQRLIGDCCQGYIQKGARPAEVLRTIRAALDAASA